MAADPSLMASEADPVVMANALRALAMDAVQQANSGHPGAPMGMAEMAVALWSRHLKHNPANPHWPDRDRFVLSNGHASALLYALLAFEVMGEPRRAAFEKAVESYVDDHLAHMRTEEREILPLAQQVLTDDDWAELDAEFQKNKDPLTGHEPADEYRDLFSRIVRMAPAPIGLG